MRNLRLAAVGLLALALLAIGVAGTYVLRARPAYEGTIAVAGITDTVEIWRDSLGVPHVWAASAADMLFAQGYAHAQDRLWQLELFRRVAEGRLAEALGPELVETDKFLRTLGLRRAAAATRARLDPVHAELLAAYVAGVNAGMRAQARPPELVALGIRPEPWTIGHSLALEKIMAWDLAAYATGLELARAVRRLGRERADILFPRYPRWGPTILDDAPPAERREAGADERATAGADERGVAGSGRGGSTGSGERRADGPARAATPFASYPLPPAPPEPAVALLDAFSMTRASNAWVIGGSRTRSGRPVLANDMHLEIPAPSLWYLMALHARGAGSGGSGDGARSGATGADVGAGGPGADARSAAYDVAGMTIPGAPFVVAGHNRAVAWGYTNGYVDDVDFFIERVDPADSTRYLVPGGSAPFEILPETVRVRGADEPVVYRLRRTRHGPVVTPVEARAGGELLAFRWAAHDPSETLTALARLNRAEGWTDFARAVDAFDAPHQNVVYADTAGHIGYWLAGRVPVRGSGRHPPLLPVPGWTGEWDWTGELPLERRPHRLGPPADYIVTANNRQTPDTTSALIASEWGPPFRALRIRELIERTAAPFTAADVHRQQLDVRDAMAARYRDRAVAAAEGAGHREAAALLRRWDLEARADSRAAALFYVWRERLRRGAARSLYADAADGGRPGWFPADAVDRILERRALPWVDGDARSAYDELAAAAMTRAVGTVGERAWGELHRVAASHALSGGGAAADALVRLLRLDLGPDAAGGSPYTVNVSHYGGEFPVTSTSGVSQRHVVDMADPDAGGGFVLPTGQSGVPFVRHYRDQWERYRHGGLWRIPLDEDRAWARSVRRMILQPTGDTQP